MVLYPMTASYHVSCTVWYFDFHVSLKIFFKHKQNDTNQNSKTPKIELTTELHFTQISLQKRISFGVPVMQIPLTSHLSYKSHSNSLFYKSCRQDSFQTDLTKKPCGTDFAVKSLVVQKSLKPSVFQFSLTSHLSCRCH